MRDMIGLEIVNVRKYLPLKQCMDSGLMNIYLAPFALSRYSATSVEIVFNTY